MITLSGVHFYVKIIEKMNIYIDLAAYSVLAKNNYFYMVFKENKKPSVSFFRRKK